CANRLSIAERNPARVLPEPVGAATRTFFPAWTSGQPSRWGGVGSPRRLRNQARTAGWKEGEDPIGMILPSYPSRGRCGSEALLEVPVHVDDEVRRAEGRALGRDVSARAQGHDSVVPARLPGAPVERGDRGSGCSPLVEPEVPGPGRGGDGGVHRDGLRSGGNAAGPRDDEQPLVAARERRSAEGSHGL